MITMKTKLFLLFTLAIGLSVSNVNAQTLRSKSRHEQQRIKQGVKSGELTKGEAFLLAKQQRNIRKDIRCAKTNNGFIGPVERRHIKKEQRMASRNIYRLKHNNRDRS
jgi:hypothetical protein